MVDKIDDLATVELWGKEVGVLSYEDDTGLCAFQYQPSWVASGVEVSPIKLPLSDQIYQFPSLPFATYKGLPAAFADTLPDDFGNALIDAWLARTGRDKDSFTAVQRLLYTGARGMGALEYSPAIEKRQNKAQSIELDSLVAMAQTVLDQRENLNEAFTDQSAQAALTTILQIGTSAGGARAKAVIGVNAERTEIRCGQCDLPDGFKHYLLKFDGVVEHSKSKETFGDPQGFGRMEYAYYLMARDAGLEMMPSEILIEGDRAHFMTERFDRYGNEKIHYQSLCAMDHADFKKPGHYSYEQIFSLMRKLRLSRSEALQMYRRMVFNIVARNHDDHTKNFGFCLEKNDKWKLAPAFDIAYSYKPDSPWVNAHQLSLNGKRDGFTKVDLLIPAETFHKEAMNIIDEVVDVVSDWERYAKQADVFPALSSEIKHAHRLNF